MQSIKLLVLALTFVFITNLQADDIHFTSPTNGADLAYSNGSFCGESYIPVNMRYYKNITTPFPIAISSFIVLTDHNGNEL